MASTINEKNLPTVKIEFIQYHKPVLKDGDYEITVKQVVKIKKKKITATTDAKEDTPFTTTRRFTVSGERFTLMPQEIYAVFPPAGSLGDHCHVLPHIVLNRSTLPWERSSDSSSDGVPWLALLLFEEDEKPEPQIITLKELKNRTGYAAKFPEIDLESGQHDDDKVTIIDVKKELLQKIIPNKEDLEYLAHVRQTKDGDGNQTGDELAIIIGNRLPKKGGISTVHLVSVENRYKNGDFNYHDAGGDHLIRLVSLKSWRFACLDKDQSFNGLLTNLNRVPSTLRLPQNEHVEAEKYLAMGYVPLPHHLRNGDKTVSWYHGPLIPGQNTNTNVIHLPVRASDELVFYNPANSLFDTSYAAAWELGRLLALQSKHLSLSLYNWKRSRVRQKRQVKQQSIHPYLYVKSKPTVDSHMPQEISDWLNSLSLLKGVPFNYLVPDESMLPKESIRFFYVDSLWVDCLSDGAMSIGRVTKSDHKRDSESKKSFAVKSHNIITGLLIRSDVVAGWPGLLVDGYDQVVNSSENSTENNKLDLLRMDRLSANVLLCLFNGEVNTVDIHQKPEALHFGLDISGNDFYKKLRNNQDISSIPWRDEKVKAININELAQAIQKMNKNGSAFTSAQFALNMIEGVEKVRFMKRAVKES